MILTASYSDVGGRSYNEDSLLIHKARDHALVILADGLGGHGHGDIASQTTVETIQKMWYPDCAGQDLIDAFQAAHRSVLSMQTPQCQMKSTAVALSISPKNIRWAYVGDSRLYHFHNGALVFQTRDHSASQIAVFLGQISPDQIRFHEDRSRIFRAIGQDGVLNVDTGEASLEEGHHAFLLCSDGFWEYVYETEMLDTLHYSVSPEQWLESMRRIHASRVKGDHDNNSAAILWLNK